MSDSDFDAAVVYVRSLPKDGPVQLDNGSKLKFYSLYKQGTEGDVKGAQPWAVQVEARAKWDAWNSCKGMSSQDAKAAYVKLLATVLRSRGVQWRSGAEVQSKL
ncbi:Acyl CoA binding protein, putative [Leishmania lindenbergi]|uniref:Acyl CoA binding protein n=1 Tax=Leishmania lindenbergi TaxID=651832 RepID=A0AAW3AKT7_9TRYP